MPVPDAMSAVLAVLKAVRARARRLRLLAGVCHVLVVVSLVMVGAALLCRGLMAVVPAAVWLRLAESGFYWHWVADGSTTPGIRVCAVLGLLLAMAWPVARLVRQFLRAARGKRRDVTSREPHPLEPACRLIAAVHRTPGEAAQTLLHLLPGTFTTQLADDTAEALGSVELARIVPARAAMLSALWALAALMALVAVARPLELPALSRHACDGLQALAGRPPRPWVVIIPPASTDRPYIILVTAAPTAPISSSDPPRLLWQSAAAPARRRVIDLEPVGRHTYLVRFGQIRRAATFVVVGQTCPSPFVISIPTPTTRP